MSQRTRRDIYTLARSGRKTWPEVRQMLIDDWRAEGVFEAVVEWKARLRPDYCNTVWPENVGYIPVPTEKIAYYWFTSERRRDDFLRYVASGGDNGGLKRLIDLHGGVKNDALRVCASNAEEKGQASVSSESRREDSSSNE